MNKPIRILLIEDDPVFRLGLQLILQQSKTALLVGEAEDGETGIALAEKLQPDIVLLDIGLPGALGASEIMKYIKQHCACTRVLALTSRSDPQTVRTMLRAGVHGYCIKGLDPEHLLNAIEKIQTGDGWWLDGKVVAHLQQPLVSADIIRLTAREREVLNLIVQGMSNQQIGKHLHISTGTVQVHVHTLLKKLNVRDRTQAAVLAVQEGLLE